MCLVDVYAEIVRLRKSGQKCALATIVQVNGSIPSYESAKMLVRDDGSIMGTIGGGCVEAEVWTAAREVIDSEKPRHLTFSLGQDAAYDNGLICGGQLDIFIEPVTPEPRAFIFGGGHVSKSISKVANMAGFATVVIDDREAFANKERFPEADETFADEYESVFPKLTISSSQLSGDRHAWASRRYARAALGREHSGALHRHDRLETEDDFRGERVGEGRDSARGVR